MDSYFSYCRQGVVAEMWSAYDKHGEVTTDPVRGALNLCEEAGEVAAEALNATRANINPDARVESLQRMVYELDQVAAYAMMLRISMENEIRRINSGLEA